MLGFHNDIFIFHTYTYTHSDSTQRHCKCEWIGYDYDMCWLADWLTWAAGWFDCLGRGDDECGTMRNYITSKQPEYYFCTRTRVSPISYKTKINRVFLQYVFILHTYAIAIAITCLFFNTITTASSQHPIPVGFLQTQATHTHSLTENSLQYEYHRIIIFRIVGINLHLWCL